MPQNPEAMPQKPDLVRIVLFLDKSMPYTLDASPTSSNTERMELYTDYFVKDVFCGWISRDKEFKKLLSATVIAALKKITSDFRDPRFPQECKAEGDLEVPRVPQQHLRRLRESR